MKELYISADKLGFIPKNRSIGWKEDFYLWMCGLQRWLREVHNIHVWCSYSADGYEYYIKTEVSDGWYPNYEEALEEGLQEALKLIKT